MTDYEAYLNYLALKLHFDGKYDYFKYGGKTIATIESFKKRKDKHQFAKLARKLSDEQISEYFIANLIRDKSWVGDFNNQNWIEHKKIIQSLEYNFLNDVEYLLTTVPEFDIILDCADGNHPKLIKAYLGKKISLETLVIFEKLLEYRKHFDTEIKETYIWKNVSLLLEKYTPFVDIDYWKYRRLLLDKVKEWQK